MPRRRKQPDPPPPPAPELMTPAERTAWRRPPEILPSQWAQRYRVIRRGSRRGPWREDNAPYLRGILDISTRPGVVQVNLKKAGRMGGSEAWRTLLAYWAHVDPRPVGMTLPSRDKGRQIIKGDILPLFRHTPVLRDLIGSAARDVLIESINLLNGFSLELMWSGSPTSTAASTFQVVGNDEVDVFEPWTGEQADAIAATEGRITTYEDRRLQFNISTPTTTAGTIHRLFEHSTVKLYYHVPCPHCGAYQVLGWSSVKYLDLQCCEACLIAATAADAAGQTGYRARWDENRRQWFSPNGAPGGPPGDRDGDREFPWSPLELGTPQALAEHIDWLKAMREALSACTDRREVANVLATHRERAVWYECAKCRGRIAPAQKLAMVRRGRWTSLDGYVTDFHGRRHEDAETVLRWPLETKIGFALSSLVCTWIHWGLLVGEWLGAQGNAAALFFFWTFRLGEAFEFRSRRVQETLFSAKSARAKLPADIVPAWAWVLLATIDTQQDQFYVVLRAWGAAQRSARVWHGRLPNFDALDRLIFGQSWAQEGGQFPPMTIALALIDSGGSLDRLLDASRTQQVYQYVLPRQPIVRAIKGANRPGPGLYWPMKNPMGSVGPSAAKADGEIGLQAYLVDTHRCNDLLSVQIATGTPSGQQTTPLPGQIAGEQWQLNQGDDAEYNAHMANVQRTVDPKTRAEIWTPKSSGARHDYRDCEAYQIAAAQMAGVHLLPADDAEVLAWKQQMTRGQTAQGRAPEPQERPPAGGFATGPL